LKKGDFIWISTLGLIVFILLFGPTHNVFIATTKAHPYLMGFVKVSILATMGELLAIRIATGDYKKPHGLIYRFIVWGFLGICFALVFDLFNGGVLACIKKGLLPSAASGTFASTLLIAFYTSAFMNIIFGPTFMAFHRVTDTYIDLGEGILGRIFKVKLSKVIGTIDWNGFIGFVVVKTIPIFWVPAHTITFLLPPEYRVLMASFLSIALGCILAFSKRKSVKTA
jgi:hypothetical protein